jgi:hypothetical protein
MARSKTRRSFTRRSLLVRTGALGVGALAVRGEKGGALAGAETEHVPPELAAVLGPVVPGLRLGEFTLRAVHGVHLGAIPLVLGGPDGTVLQVDVLRFDPQGPNGIAHARGLTLALANRGDGRTRTDEQHGRVAMTLAALMAEAPAAPLPPALVTIDERGRRFPDGCFAVRA